MKIATEMNFGWMGRIIAYDNLWLLGKINNEEVFLMEFWEILTCIYMAVVPDGIPAIISLVERKKRGY